MPNFYSPDGNYEVWDEKPAGYFTKEEWDELHPPTPYVPRKEEKLAQLDAQYDSGKALLSQYFVEAALANDTELQQELQDELTELNNDYVEQREAIEQED